MSQPGFDPVNSRASIASFVFLGTISVLSFIVQPALVQGFVTVLGLSEPAAVNLAFIEMAGVGLATILVALISARVDWRALTAAALLIATFGNAWSALELHGAHLGAARFIAGFGHGGVISLSFTFVGLTRRVDRNLAIYLVSLLSYSAVGIWIAPTVFEHSGLAPVFWAFALATAASLLVVRFVPASSAARTEVSPHARQLGLGFLAAALASVFAYNIAQGIAWAILFLVGTAAGHAMQAVANALLVSNVAAVTGALGAVFLAHRVQRVPAIVLGILGGAACIGLLPGSSTMAVYLVAVCGFNLLWNFVMPFIFGAVCDMDTQGRMMTPAIAVQMNGLAAGPFLTAPLITGGSYAGAELLCIACFVASLLLLSLPLVAHSRQR
jgi:hypothetical protein